MTATIKLVPLDRLQANPRNPKRHATATIGNSLDRFGVIEPVVVDARTGYLISGHGRVETLAEKHAAGEPAPDGIEVLKNGKWKVPAVVGWRSKDDAEADAALIALNRTGQIGGWDDVKLAEMLATLAETDKLVGVGYTESDLDVLQRVVEAEGQFTMDFTDVIDEFLEGTGTSSPDYEKNVFRVLRIAIPDEAGARQLFETLGVEYDEHCRSIPWPRPIEKRPSEVFDA